MNTRTLGIAAGATLVVATLISPASAAATRNGCDAARPQAELPGTDTAPGDATTDTLTEKLATCGSVLNPPPLGDVDIVEPTPPVGDDIDIHPDARAGVDVDAGVGVRLLGHHARHP